MGLAVNMSVEGQPESFHGQTLQREEGAAGSSAGGSVAAASPMFDSGTRKCFFQLVTAAVTSCEDAARRSGEGVWRKNFSVFYFSIFSI